MWMTRVSVHHPVFAVMVMLAIGVLGIFSYQRLGVEQMPEVSLPFVSVQFSYPGASPEGMEQDVAKPAERALNTLPHVKKIRSTVGEGWGWVNVEFDLKADGEKSMQLVRDKIAQLRQSLPRDVKEPQISRANQENQQSIMFMVLYSKERSLRELSFLAEKTVRQQLERINGVGALGFEGTSSREVAIRLKPDALLKTGVSAEQITAALRSMNLNAPVGEIRGAGGEAIVRVDGRIKSVADFEQLVVLTRPTDRGPVTIRLSQVADVIDAESETRSLARYGGAPGVGINVYKVQDANMVNVGRDVAKAVDQLKKVLPPDVELKIWWSSAKWVEQSLNNVTRTIFEGALLTLGIVFLFLASWRSTIITGLTLPIAVVATFIALYAFGFTLNYLTLMALSLCIGLLIDDAIVVRENISRHAAMGKNPIDAALDGTNEIGLAVIATTLSIVAVFVPIAFMSGVIGKFFFAFGITVAVAVLISLFVSFTLDPMLSAYWRDPNHGEHGASFGMPLVGPLLKRFDGFMTRLEARYQRVMAWALRKKKTTVAIAFASLLASFALLPLVGSEFMPEVDQGYTSVQMQLPPGSTLAYANEKAKRAEVALAGFKEIELMGTYVGARSVNLSLKLVDKKQRKRSQKELEQAMREALATIPGQDLQVGWNRPIYVAVLGNGEEELNRVSKELERRIKAIDGITDLELSTKLGTPALSVRLKPEAAQLGITHAQIGSLLRTLISGEDAGTWAAPDGENYSLQVRYGAENRSSLADLRQVNVAAGRTRADGSPLFVPLEQVATIDRIDSPETIRRQDLQRRVALWAGIKDTSQGGRSLGEVSADVKKVIKEMEAGLPLGMRFDVGGQQQELDDTLKSAVAALGLAVIFLYFILGSQFGSFLQPLAIMASLPLAMIGVVLALLLTRTTLNIFSMIGIIMLMGLVTKNAILLVDQANRAQRERGLDQHAALLEAGKVRLRPILMTTAAMILGMMPLALGLGEGSEQQSPMGRAIIGGVITSTLLTLVVIPVLYTWADRKGAKARKLALQATAVPVSPQPVTP
jgi:hydrophobic/amphiphilic exporter-1 (mainly G- bacteria), HAE1 family